jgi:hypothetical protein
LQELHIVLSYICMRADIQTVGKADLFSRNTSLDYQSGDSLVADVARIRQGKSKFSDIRSPYSNTGASFLVKWARDQ